MKKSPKVSYLGGGFIKQVKIFFPPSAENPQMKLFYEAQKLRIPKSVYNSNPQLKFFGRFAPIFRGGFLFNRYFEMPKFLLFRGGFLFHWGFLFCDGRQLLSQAFSTTFSMNFKKLSKSEGKLQNLEFPITGFPPNYPPPCWKEGGGVIRLPSIAK